MKRIFLLSLIMITVFSCQIEEELINYNVTNNSAEEIYIAFDYGNSVISSFDDPLISDGNNVIPSMESYQYSVNEDELTSLLELTLIIVTKSVYESNSWQDIVDNDMYDQRYDLTRSELKDLNNVIIYN